MRRPSRVRRAEGPLVKAAAMSWGARALKQQYGWARCVVGTRKPRGHHVGRQGLTETLVLMGTTEARRAAGGRGR